MRSASAAILSAWLASMRPTTLQPTRARKQRPTRHPNGRHVLVSDASTALRKLVDSQRRCGDRERTLCPETTMTDVRRLMLLPALFCSSCIPPAEYHLVRTSTAPVQAKPPTCDFRVVSLPPDGAYAEVATLTPDTTTGEAVMDPEDFKRRLRADVCSVGVYVVVTHINVAVAYERGIVLRRTGGQ